MGVKDTSELLPNYVSEELEDENDDDIIQVQACVIKEMNNRTKDLSRIGNNLPIYSLHSNTSYSSIDVNVRADLN